MNTDKAIFDGSFKPLSSGDTYQLSLSKTWAGGVFFIKKYDSEETAWLIYKASEQLRGQHMAIAYPPIKNTFIAFETIGESLSAFLRSNRNRELLLDSHNGTAFRMSYFYKKIARDLIKIVKVFMEKGLCCDLNHDYIFINGVERGFPYIEVSNISRFGRQSFGFDVLADFLDSSVFGSVQDLEKDYLISFLRRCYAGGINQFFKSSFFWLWDKRMDFIVELADVEKKTEKVFTYASHVLDDHWVERIESDLSLKSLKRQYDQHRIQITQGHVISHNPVYECLHFMRATYKHFKRMQASILQKQWDFTIHDRKELQSCYEYVFPGHVTSLANACIPLKNFSFTLRSWLG